MAPHTIHVTFAINTYTVTLPTVTGATVAPSGGSTSPVNHGGNYSFTVTLDAAYNQSTVVVKTNGTVLTPAAGVYTISNITANQTVTVEGVQINTYTVALPTVTGATIAPSGGSTSPVNHGGNYSFTVDLLEGYTQSTITVYANDEIITPEEGVYTIENIVEDQEVTVTGVTLNEYRIVAKANYGGTISPEGTIMVAHGDSKTFNITPDANYQIKDVLVNGISVGTVTSYTFANVIADGEIEAYFDNIGIDENNLTPIHVFSYNNIVTILNEGLTPIKQVEIMDMYGRMVWKGQAPDIKTEIPLTVAKSIYLVRITTTTNQSQTTKVNINH
jgi:type IV pilus assembly protein PilY1